MEKGFLLITWMLSSFLKIPSIHHPLHSFKICILEVDVVAVPLYSSVQLVGCNLAFFKTYTVRVP